jgi:hypothetical protein
VGAWRRRSIVVPHSEPSEPCEAWWIQSADVFVDVRVAAPGQEDNGLPYSSTRAFAGRFDIVAGQPCWHVELDSGGHVPRVDRGAIGGLFLEPGDPLLMIEDAPGRFREEWVQCAPAGEVKVVRSAGIVSVRVGDIVGVVQSMAHGVTGRVSSPDRVIAVVPVPMGDRPDRAW